jgi:O-antigen ligase/Flp pilus assembly protein TadD
MRLSPPRASSSLIRQDDQSFRSSKLRLAGVALLAAKVALTPLVFDLTFDVPFTVPKVLLSHALSYGVASVIVALFVRFGGVLFVRSWLHVPVFAFLATNTMATILSVDKTLALYGTHVRMLGLGTTADYVMLYLGIVLLVRQRREVIVILASGLAASVVVLCYEGVQLLGLDPLRWSTTFGGRPFSTLGQPTSLGQYLTIVLSGCLAFALLVEALPRWIRAALLLYCALLLAGIGATGTRSAILGLAAGTLTVIGLTWGQRSTRRGRALAASATLLMMGALTALLLFSPIGSRITAELDNPLGEDTGEDTAFVIEPTTDPRLALYAIALEAVRARPLLGYGPDNFVAAVPAFRTDNEPYAIRQSLATSAHSWLTQVATSSGLLGLIAFLAIPLTAMALTVRAAVRSLATVGAALMAAFLGAGLTTINDIVCDSMFWAAAGFVAAAAAPTFSTSERVPNTTKRGRRPPITQLSSVSRRTGAALCIAVGLALMLSTANALDASRSMRTSQVNRLDGRVREAVAFALRATRGDPGRAEYWHGLALAYIAGSELSNAAAMLERAAVLAPYDARYTNDLARVLLLMDNAGDRGARGRAIIVADRGVRVDPNNPRTNITRALVMLVAGNLSEATASIERALALDPQSNNADLHITASQIYLAAGRPDQAVDAARKGLTFLATRRSVELRVQLARVLLATGQAQTALGEIDGALSIRPNDAAALRLRAEITAALD